MAQVQRSPKAYDVCVIGSGAAGGTAAKAVKEIPTLSIVALSWRYSTGNGRPALRNQKRKTIPALTRTLF